MIPGSLSVFNHHPNCLAVIHLGTAAQVLTPFCLRIYEFRITIAKGHFHAVSPAAGNPF